MTSINWTRRIGLLGLGALSATALTGGAANAAQTLTGTAPTYASQAVLTAGALSIPSGLGFSDTAVVDGTACTSPNNNVTVTFTLPSGVTFTSVPTVTADGTNYKTATVQNSPIGTSSLVAQATVAHAGTGTLTLGTFSVTGASSLSTAATTIKWSASVVYGVTTATTGCGTNGSASATAFAVSASGLTFTTSPGSAFQIDVGSSGLGKKFVGSPDTLFGDLGAINSTLTNVLNASGATFTFGTTVGTLTVNGNFSGISGAYLAPTSGANVCSTTGTAPSGSFTGSVTASAITFNNVTVPSTSTSTTGELCITAGGTSIIGANTTGATANFAIAGTSSQNATSQNTSGSGTTNLTAYNYNGSIQQILYSGNFGSSGYTPFIRLVNNTSGSLTTLAVVQSEAGSTGSTTAATLAANTNALLAASTLVTNSGVTLDSTGRASLLFLTPGATCSNNLGNEGTGGNSCSVSVSQLLLNPDGDVVQLGSGQSP